MLLCYSLSRRADMSSDLDSLTKSFEKVGLNDKQKKEDNEERKDTDKEKEEKEKREKQQNGKEESDKPLDKKKDEVDDFEAGKYITRLLLGEGNFTYAYARAKKYGEEDVFIATEYESLLPTLMARKDSGSLEEWRERINFIQAGGLRQIHLGIDATQIHTDPQLHPNLPLLRRYSRIHFNLPYAHAANHDKLESRAETRLLVYNFFQAASQVQRIGDRIYMALVANKWHLQTPYAIQTAAGGAGYVMKRRKKFLSRFKPDGYKHTTTHGSSSSECSRHAQEYIFHKIQKVPWLPRKEVREEGIAYSASGWLESPASGSDTEPDA
jgi:hypothetical protein